MKRKNNLKLPNGFGSILFLGNKRRHPYAALKTTGWDDNGRQIRKYVGYAKTYNEAYQILLNYSSNPFDINSKNITLNDIYPKIADKMAIELENSKISKSTYAGLLSAWNKQLIALKDIKIIDLKRKDIQNIIDNSNLKHTGRTNIKTLASKIILYAKDEYDLRINFDLNEVKIGEKEKSTKHKPFSDAEVRKIENVASINQIGKMLVIYFYTGLRPSELLQIKIKNVFLAENYMIGGIKTAAGKNRIIPIHSNIKQYVQEFYEQNKDKEFLIMNNNNNMTYDVYEDRFKKFMVELNMNHIPHDTRHTFATKLDELNFSESIIKRLMGHSLSNDVTNDVYIHKSAAALYKEISRLKY